MIENLYTLYYFQNTEIFEHILTFQFQVLFVRSDNKLMLRWPPEAPAHWLTPLRHFHSKSCHPSSPVQSLMFKAAFYQTLTFCHFVPKAAFSHSGPLIMSLKPPVRRVLRA